MTDVEKKIEKELLDRLKKRCGRRVMCGRCPYQEDRLSYECGGLGRMAIQVIIEERVKNGTLTVQEKIEE